MSKDGQRVAGFIVLFAALAGLAYFLAGIDRFGHWLWVFPGGLIVVGGFLAYKFPGFRSGVRTTGVTIGNWLGALGGSDESGKSSRQSERRAIPKMVQQHVLARAGNRCQFPNCRVSGRELLDIHHIDMNPSNSNDDSNLIVVCPSHHRALHRKGVAMATARRWAMRGRNAAAPRRDERER